MNPIRLPSGVGFIGVQIAAERARESARADALFIDPLAVALVDQVTGEGEGAGPPPYLSREAQWLFGDFVALRTHFLDEQIAAAVRDVSQVVVIAAGLDGRGYRLDWPAGTRVFELERAEVLDFKRQVVERAGVAPTVELVPVAGDIRHDWPSLLRAKGFDAERPTLWLLEGILGYLGPEDGERLMAEVSALSKRASRLLTVYAVGDLVAVATRAGRDGDADIARFKELAQTGPSVDPDAWLPAHGWQVETTTIAAWARRLGRAVPPSMDPENGGATYHFVSARRA